MIVPASNNVIHHLLEGQHCWRIMVMWACSSWIFAWASDSLLRERLHGRTTQSQSLAPSRFPPVIHSSCLWGRVRKFEWRNSHRHSLFRNFLLLQSTTTWSLQCLWQDIPQLRHRTPCFTIPFICSNAAHYTHTHTHKDTHHALAVFTDCSAKKCVLFKSVSETFSE